MRMEGRTSIVPRKDLNTKRWRAEDESYTQKPWRPPRRTRRNSKNYRVGQPKLLLAKHEGNNQKISQELRHLPTKQSGPTCTIWNVAIGCSSKQTMEVDHHGLHYRPSKLRRIWHNPHGHQPPDQNESLHIRQQGPESTAVCNIISQRNRSIARHTQRRYHR